MNTPGEKLQVIALCAGWCGVCRDWRAVFAGVAQAHPEWQFAWVDVEDEDEAMGGVDVDTFPTVLVARGGDALFLGAIGPSAGALERLVKALESQAQPLGGPEAALLARLRPAVLARSLI